jgi:hypothetical protein
LSSGGRDDEPFHREAVMGWVLDALKQRFGSVEVIPADELDLNASALRKAVHASS